MHSNIWDVCSAIFSDGYLHSPAVPLRNQRWLTCTHHQLYKRYVESKYGESVTLWLAFTIPLAPCWTQPFWDHSADNWSCWVSTFLLRSQQEDHGCIQGTCTGWKIYNCIPCLVFIALIMQKQNQMSKVASVAGFITEIQSSLSVEAFQTFKKALGAYKDVSCPNDCMYKSA